MGRKKSVEELTSLLAIAKERDTARKARDALKKLQELHKKKYARK